MIAPKLIIGGVEIALQTFPASQDYDVLEGATVHRMLNGSAAKQSHWRKITTRVSGDGWAPAALAGVDWTAPVEISCIQARAIHSATVNATLPAARRIHNILEKLDVHSKLEAVSLAFRQGWVSGPNGELGLSAEPLTRQ